METAVFLEVEEVTIGDMALSGFESAGAEECISCPEVVRAPLVTAVFSEERMASVPVEASEVDSISMVVLITLVGELVSGSKLGPNLSVVFTRPWVRSEVTGVGEEGFLAGDVEGSEEGDIIAGIGAGEDGEPVSSMKEGVVPDTSSAPLLIEVIISVCRSPWVTAAWIPTMDDVIGVSWGGVLCDTATEGPFSMVTALSVDSVLVRKVKSVVIFSVEFIGDPVEAEGPGLSLPLDEMSSVLVTSVTELVLSSGRTVTGSGDELISLEVLVSLTLKVKVELVSILVVSEKLDLDVETIVFPMVVVVLIGNMALDGPESDETKERDSCSELVVPTLVTTVFLEGSVLEIFP